MSNNVQTCVTMSKNAQNGQTSKNHRHNQRARDVPATFSAFVGRTPATVPRRSRDVPATPATSPTSRDVFGKCRFCKFVVFLNLTPFSRTFVWNLHVCQILHSPDNLRMDCMYTTIFSYLQLASRPLQFIFSGFSLSLSPCLPLPLPPPSPSLSMSLVQPLGEIAAVHPPMKSAVSLRLCATP